MVGIRAHRRPGCRRKGLPAGGGGVQRVQRMASSSSLTQPAGSPRRSRASRFPHPSAASRLSTLPHPRKIRPLRRSSSNAGQRQGIGSKSDQLLQLVAVARSRRRPWRVGARGKEQAPVARSRRRPWRAGAHGEEQAVDMTCRWPCGGASGGHGMQPPAAMEAMGMGLS